MLDYEGIIEDTYVSPNREPAVAPITPSRGLVDRLRGFYEDHRFFKIKRKATATVGRVCDPEALDDSVLGTECFNPGRDYRIK